MSRVLRPVPNRKIFHEPANSKITEYTMTPEEIAKRYPKEART